MMATTMAETCSC